MKKKKEYYNLTEKEREVMYYLAMGYSNKKIADKMSTSTHTVKAHLASIYEKLRTANRLQAVIRALQLKLIYLEEIAITATDVEAKYC